MYRAYQYNEDLHTYLGEHFERYFEIGNSINDKHKRNIEESLEKFYIDENTINGRELKDSWFPKIDADVFLSHSHKDEKTVIAFAGFLSSELNITSFIDSTVWGYANDLQRQIDNKWCKLPFSESYDYNSRNFSTSHVHLMLNTALLEMLDKTECVIFMNTSNSIESVSEVVSNGTYSPWIYSELHLLKYLRMNQPIRYFEKSFNTKREFRNDSASENLQVLHDVTSPLESLITLHGNHLNALLVSRMHNRELSPHLIAKENLDRLYKIAKPEKKIAK